MTTLQSGELAEIEERLPAIVDEKGNEIVEWNPHDQPQMMVASAAAQARRLSHIINTQQPRSRWVSRIGDQDFLRLEAWQLLAQFNDRTIVIDQDRPVKRDGQIVGYEAKALVKRLSDGEIVGQAYAMCSVKARVTRGENDPIEKEQRARSMAQTRAASKALRLTHSWIAVLAGYNPTPADEMTYEQESAPETSRPSFMDEDGVISV